MRRVAVQLREDVAPLAGGDAVDRARHGDRFDRDLHAVVDGTHKLVVPDRGEREMLRIDGFGETPVPEPSASEVDRLAGVGAGFEHGHADTAMGDISYAPGVVVSVFDDGAGDLGLDAGVHTCLIEFHDAISTAKSQRTKACRVMQRLESR